MLPLPIMAIRVLSVMGSYVGNPKELRELVKLDGRPLKDPAHTGKISRPAADKWASDQIRAYKERIKLEAEDNGEKALKQIMAQVKALPSSKKKNT